MPNRALLWAGIALLLAGMALVAASVVSGAQPASYGAVILIGPVPILMGGGPWGPQLVALAALLAVVLMALALLFYLSRPAAGEPEGGGDQEGQD